MSALPQVSEENNQESLLSGHLIAPPLPSTNLNRITLRRKPVPSSTISSHHTINLQRNSSQYSQLPNRDDDTTNLASYELVDRRSLSVHHHNDKEKGSPPYVPWTPRALQYPSLLAILISNALILALVVFLHIRSASSLGLIDDDGSSAIFFAWRFAPTLVAVFYVTSLMITLDAVKRTEAFARLTKPGGSTGEATILWPGGPWWSLLVDSFPRANNGKHWSWTMLCAVLVYILGFLVVSPFSSALLAPREITLAQDTPFRRVQPATLPVQLELGTLTYYQTIGHILQNVTTSAWITDQFTVLPFWPSTYATSPTGSILANSTELWTAQTTVFQTELTCEDMTPISVAWNYSYSYSDPPGSESQNTTESLYTYLFTSSSGCEYGLAVPDYAFETTSLPSYESSAAGQGFMYWSNLSSVPIDGYEDWGSSETQSDSGYWQHRVPNVALNHTSQCDPGEVIITLVKVPTSDDSEARGQLCRYEYYSGDVEVTASLSPDSSILAFDEEQFRQVRAVIKHDTMDTPGFEEVFLSADWNKYMVKGQSMRAEAGGPSGLLAAQHNFKLQDIATDESLASKAATMKQRAFGQALQAALFANGQSSEVTIQGQITSNKRRIVVVQAVAYIIEVVLTIQLGLLTVVVFISRPVHRPLSLSQDPAFPNTIASLVSTQNTAQQQLCRLHSESETEVTSLLGHQTYEIAGGVLCSVNSQSEVKILERSTACSAQSSHGTPWRPVLLSIWTMAGLTTLLTALLIVVAVLYWYANTYGLHQTAFVYQVQVAFGTDTFGVLAPYSIIPTLVGVGIGLWWGAVESLFRNVQPFIAMAKRPTPSGRGSGVSYQSSYLIWAALRAAKRKHWLLALVCIGAFFSQILTIAMSALWQREPSSLEWSSFTEQPLQLRQIPHLYQGQAPSSFDYPSVYMTDVLGHVFDNLQTSWMYGAIIQLSLNGSEPKWSRDGWSFIPVPLAPALVNKNVQKLGSDKQQFGQTSNTASVITPAIRGRLECQPWDEKLDVQYWLKEHDLTNDTLWNVTFNPNIAATGYEFGCGNDNNLWAKINLQPNVTDTDSVCSSIGAYTYFLTTGAQATCCDNGTFDEPGRSAFGHWTKTLQTVQSTSDDYQPDFTVKWLYGRASEHYRRVNYTTPHLMWMEVPQLAMISCVPIIETANATVILDASTGRVQNFSILSQPSPYPLAWADNFLIRENPNKTKSYGEESTVNVTTSYGVMFMEALLKASQLNYMSGCGASSCGNEDLDDRTYNFRLPGLNLDYASYGMLSLVDNDPTALLDVGVLTAAANKSFSTFFQHFASNNVSLDGAGGWVYQRVNATLPSDLPDHDYNVTLLAPSSSSEHTNATTILTISQPIEILRPSPLAVWLCLCILAWLIFTALLITFTKKSYFSPLLRRTDRVVDVAMMVAGSERYLALAREKGATGLQADKNFRTKLGWFRNGRGEVRWGIELCDAGVEFLSEEEVSKLLATSIGGEKKMANIWVDEVDLHDR